MPFSWFWFVIITAFILAFPGDTLLIIFRNWPGFKPCIQALFEWRYRPEWIKSFKLLDFLLCIFRIILIMPCFEHLFEAFVSHHSSYKEISFPCILPQFASDPSIINKTTHTKRNHSISTSSQKPEGQFIEKVISTAMKKSKAGAATVTLAPTGGSKASYSLAKKSQVHLSSSFQQWAVDNCNGIEPWKERLFPMWAV